MSTAKELKQLGPRVPKQIVKTLDRLFKSANQVATEVITRLPSLLNLHVAKLASSPTDEILGGIDFAVRHLNGIYRHGLREINGVFKKEELCLIIECAKGFKLNPDLPGQLIGNNVKGFIELDNANKKFMINGAELTKKIDRLTKDGKLALEIWANGFWATYPFGATEDETEDYVRHLATNPLRVSDMDGFGNEIVFELFDVEVVEDHICFGIETPAGRLSGFTEWLEERDGALTITKSLTDHSQVLWALFREEISNSEQLSKDLSIDDLLPVGLIYDALESYLKEGDG